MTRTPDAGTTRPALWTDDEADVGPWRLEASAWFAGRAK